MAPRTEADIYPALARIPAFPPVANRVMGMLASGEAEIAALVALIEKDPAFGIEVLRLANSPLCSTRGNVRTLTQAIAQIGFSRLRSLTMTVALRSVMRAALTRPIVRQCWTHSLACGLIAKKFGKGIQFDEDEAYTLGLLHDVGRLGLLAAFPDEYGNLLAHTYRSQAELMTAEDMLLGLDHCRAGAILASQWHLSDALRETAAGHHELPHANTSRGTRLVHIACRLADCLGFGANTTGATTLEDVLSVAPRPLAEAIDEELPDLNVNLVKELNALRLC